ncbi:hypothetical protein [Henriciella mobilis]|uniref:hypothetical protein n=1 Tax=Henriciella mobilis TaxID=2305467 RepID=UPI0011C45792|nr:hypothetical protein [Henriciella mobilis]
MMQDGRIAGKKRLASSNSSGVTLEESIDLKMMGLLTGDINPSKLSDEDKAAVLRRSKGFGLHREVFARMAKSQQPADQPEQDQITSGVAPKKMSPTEVAQIVGAGAAAAGVFVTGALGVANLIVDDPLKPVVIQINPTAGADENIPTLNDIMDDLNSIHTYGDEPDRGLLEELSRNSIPVDLPYEAWEQAIGHDNPDSPSSTDPRDYEQRLLSLYEEYIASNTGSFPEYRRR